MREEDPLQRLGVVVRVIDRIKREFVLLVIMLSEIK